MLGIAYINEPILATTNIPQWFQKFRFKTPIQVRFSDTDMLGHINNVSYFSYFGLGQLAYFKSATSFSPYLFNLKEKQSIVTAPCFKCKSLPRGTLRAVR